MLAYKSKTSVLQRIFVFVLVAIAHLLLVYWLKEQLTLPVVKQPPQSSIQAVIIMPIALPNQAQQTQIEPVPAKTVSQPSSKPANKVLPDLAPSDKAISVEKSTVAEKSEPIAEPKISAPTTLPDVVEVAVAKEPVLVSEPEITPPRSDATSLNNPNPTYPAMSRRLAEQGKVLLDVLILANGKVGEIKLKQSSGYKRLDDAALQTVKQWRFQPAKRGNQAIDYWYIQPISFSLNS